MTTSEQQTFESGQLVRFTYGNLRGETGTVLQEQRPMGGRERSRYESVQYRVAPTDRRHAEYVIVPSFHIEAA